VYNTLALLLSSYQSTTQAPRAIEGYIHNDLTAPT
jgi:hypothetical protein